MRGAIDDLHMMVGAGVLVDGVPAFSARPPNQMRLNGARQLGDSNIALLLYSLGWLASAHEIRERRQASVN